MRRGTGSHADPTGRTAEDAAAAAHYVAESASDETKDLFKKQAGLQAVRGLGVSLVIFHHMTGKMTNAAAVFDAFFVISGYLISLRLIMLAQTASIRDYFVKFYVFRVRRIFPAAIVTLVLTAIVANLIYLPNRAHDATVDTIWAFFFVANWHFAHNAVDYFSAGATSSPVLNFWSLSVEEQFYLAWPLVILIALFVARRRGRGTGVAPVAIVIIAVSYAYGWWMSRTHPIQAYYDTFARVWDFGIGALMANIAVAPILRKGRAARPASDRPKPLWLRLHLRARGHAELVSWVGVVLFILAMFFTPPLGYPVPSASFGLLGMGVIFYADTLKRDPNAVFAKARPFVWLGDISYSLYAIHFPIVIFATSYLSGNRARMYAFDVAASLCAAVLMYHFVEKPFRQSWKQNVAWFRSGDTQKVVVQASCLGLAAALLFAFPWRTPAPIYESGPAPAEKGAVHVPAVGGDAIDLGRSVPPNLQALAAQLPTTFSDPYAVTPTASIARALREAVALRSWPPVSNLARIDRTRSFVDPCDTVDPLHPPCIASPGGGIDPAKVVLGYGDSTVLTYFPMLRDALVPRGWTVVMYGLTACPAADVIALGGGNVDACRAHHAAFAATLERWRPKLVFMSSAEHSDVEVAGGSLVLPQDQAVAAYQAGLGRSIAMVRGVGARAVVLSPPPVGYDLSTCDVAGSSPGKCVHSPLGTWYLLNRTDRAATSAANGTYADLVQFFCSDLVCPGVSGGLAIRSDNVHLTPEYAAQLAPSFERYLLNQGLLR